MGEKSQFCLGAFHRSFKMKKGNLCSLVKIVVVLQLG